MSILVEDWFFNCFDLKKKTNRRNSEAPNNWRSRLGRNRTSLMASSKGKLWQTHPRGSLQHLQLSPITNFYLTYLDASFSWNGNCLATFFDGSFCGVYCLVVGPAKQLPAEPFTASGLAKLRKREESVIPRLCFSLKAPT